MIFYDYDKIGFFFDKKMGKEKLDDDIFRVDPDRSPARRHKLQITGREAVYALHTTEKDAHTLGF